MSKVFPQKKTDSKVNGRPPYKKSSDMVKVIEILRSAGFTQEMIANAARIDKKTLRKYYSEEMKAGKDYANGQIAAMLYTKAMRGDVRALVYWTKARMGWSEQDDTGGTTINIVPQRIETPVIEGEVIDHDAVLNQ